MNQRICDYDFCKDYICCPITDIKPTFINTEERTRYLNIIGGSCVDEKTGEAGVCKPLHRCHDLTSLNPYNRVNYTTCGFDLCTKLICCPNQKLTTKSQQGWYRFF